MLRMKWVCSLCVFVFILLPSNMVLAFFPNNFVESDKLELGENTLTHYDITEIGILKAVAAFFEENPRPGSKIKRGELTGMKDIALSELFQKYYGDEVSLEGTLGAIETIATANENVDVEHPSVASWHVNGETIPEANERMITIRETILNIFKGPNPNLDHAIQLIGQFLHIMQMFYSNTNWVENFGSKLCYSLGIRGQPLYGQAPPKMDTCLSCRKPGSPCLKNLITGKTILTSGYKDGQDRQKPQRDPRQYKSGKCSHGGYFDEGGKTKAPLGGINKDSTNPVLSPHHYLHTTAAEAAIAHTTFFFEDKKYGLRHLIGDSNYQKLLKLKSGKTMALVIDYSGSMSDDIEAVREKIADILRTVSGKLEEPSGYIISLFNDPKNLTKVEQFDSTEDTLKYIEAISVDGGMDCPEYSMDGIEKALALCEPESVLYVFTDASAKDPEREDFIKTLASQKKVKISSILTGSCGSRKKRFVQDGSMSSASTSHRRLRRSNSMDIYDSLAEETGGFVYVTTKVGINKVAEIIKERVVTSSVLILSKSMASIRGTEVTVPVDSSVKQLSIKIKTEGALPTQEIRDPNGNAISEMDLSDIGGGLRLIKITSPESGVWTIRKEDVLNWKLEVSAQSLLDISTKFVQKNPATGFEYTLSGRPIAGDNATLICKLLSAEQMFSLDGVLVLDSQGDELERHEGLSKVHSRGGLAVFRRQFQLPGKSFYIAVTGKDKDGHTFRRLVSQMIVPVNIKLKILNVEGSLYINERLSIPFEVTNQGDAESTITVTASDDQGFTLPPLSQTFVISQKEREEGIFWLRADERERVTTTLTLRANHESFDEDRFQYAVRRFTTTKRVIRPMDNKDPTCRLLRVNGKCDVSVIDPCLCASVNWSARAEVSDDGFGLFQVGSSITNEGGFSVQNFSMGHKKPIEVNLSTTCCDAVAYINVVDMSSNVAQCNINVVYHGEETLTNSTIIDFIKSKRTCTPSSTSQAPENDVIQVKGTGHASKLNTALASTLLILTTILL